MGIFVSTTTFFFSRTPILSGNTGEGDKEFLVPKDTNESKLFLTVYVCV